MVRAAMSAAALLGSTAAPIAQSAVDAAPAYCSGLKHVTAIAMSERRLTRIAARPRNGNFSDTTVPLTGWNDCSVYGGRTYTCDSGELKTAEEAERALPAMLTGIKTCLGPAWTEVEDRSSSSYLVLHGPRAVSITISTDQTGDQTYVVRLTLFLRSQ